MIHDGRESCCVKPSCSFVYLDDGPSPTYAHMHDPFEGICSRYCYLIPYLLFFCFSPFTGTSPGIEYVMYVAFFRVRAGMDLGSEGFLDKPFVGCGRELFGV